MTKSLKMEFNDSEYPNEYPYVIYGQPLRYTVNPYMTYSGTASLHMPVGPYYTGTKTRFRVFIALPDGTVIPAWQ